MHGRDPRSNVEQAYAPSGTVDGICKELSECGCYSLSTNRKHAISGICGALQLMGFVFSVVCSMGLGSGASYIKNFAYMSYPKTLVNGTTYINLVANYTEFSDGREGVVTMWYDDDNSDCGGATPEMYFCMVLATAAKPAGLFLSVQRGELFPQLGGDNNAKKLFSLISVGVGLLLMTYMLGRFGYTCCESINDKHQQGDS